MAPNQPRNDSGRRRRRWWVGLILTTAVVAIVWVVRAPSDIEVPRDRGMPEDVELGDFAGESMGPMAAWATEPGHLYVMTWGSGSCPNVVTRANWGGDAGDGDQSVELTTRSHGRGPCTDDYSSRVGLIDLSRRYDGGSLTVIVDDVRSESEPAVIELPAQG